MPLNSVSFARYGRPTVAVSRKTIARGEQKQVSLELHPPRFRVLRLSDAPADSLKVETPSHPYITLSSHDNLRSFTQKVAKSVSPTTGYMGPYRIWKVDTNADNFDFDYSQYPLSQLDQDEKNIINGSDQTIEEALLETDDAFAVEFKGEQHWLVNLANQPAPAPLFNSNEGFFNRMGPKPLTPTTKSYDTSITTFSNKSTPTTGISGKVNGILSKTLEPGTLGLGNMFVSNSLVCCRLLTFIPGVTRAL
jgi:ubiquitin carboxyl-terminal hydrolase 4/11